MNIKVCGMKYPDNISALLKLEIDYIGLIQYPKSPRYCPLNNVDWSVIKRYDIEPIAVFVNCSSKQILETVKDTPIKTIQLHGEEPIRTCIELKEMGYKVIKAFGIDAYFSWSICEEYTPYIDLILLDTKTPKYGGTGKKFDWEILKDYPYQTPFFLSGGIELDDLSTIMNIAHKKLYGVDVNSRFEDSPGRKNIHNVNTLVEKIKDFHNTN
ncbi:phosphoribosylanthranilate isomerase [Halosquirtibacter laminarini]|uniref:Phosphoribosylanthranilate isomerase n=1 Tax=Halosquirtibacter laminarini TaxID=3374600 RepID=A0AC61NPC6_9BACT|nr:phosphoribosylanthranilate isomerase [Prolixibacteraceae bacterium]